MVTRRAKACLNTSHNERTRLNISSLLFLRYYLRASTTAPVTSKFSSARGSITFQPQDINWSKRGLGSAARNRMNMQMKNIVFAANHKGAGSHGPSQPPKNNNEMVAEIRVTPMYSPTKNMPNFMPEYSE